MDPCDQKHCKSDKSGRTLKKARTDEYVPTFKTIVYYFMVTDTLMCAKQAKVKMIRYLPEENSYHAQFMWPHMLEPESEKFVRNIVLDADNEVRFFDPATGAVVDSLAPELPKHRVLGKESNAYEKKLNVADHVHPFSKNELLRFDRPVDESLVKDGWFQNTWNL